jgi:hypothetical protein
MRMSDLIEDCEDDLEFGVDADLEEGIVIRSALGKKPSRCPRGFVVDLDSGKCIKKDVAERNAKQRSKNFRASQAANAAANKKPGLVDRMKAMFGKK